ncbi:MAG TPA: hypothetical protein VNI54_12570 [Thermoanaerobaculia bacterium]|nr:hypothetical protein [Thermoanaerobaculia bacterium]
MRLFALIYSAISFFFAAAAVVLVFRAVATLWHAVTQSPTQVSQVIESIGILAIALVALEIAQTVMEEEVVRRSQVSAPTRVRRYLSRFLVVVVVALSIKYLVAVVRFLEGDPRLLWNASSIGVATAALLAAWGVFIRLNRAAEDVEPEAMADAKREDENVQ